MAALLIGIPLCIGATGLAVVALSDDWDDDEESTDRRQRTEMMRKMFPLNERSVVITQLTGHLGLTLESTPEGRGCRVANIDPNGDAAQSGLLVGDWITSINGMYVEAPKDAIRLATLVRHNGYALEVTVMSRCKIVMEVANYTTDLGVTLRTDPAGRGALVSELARGSLLAQQGLQVGDVITTVNGKAVAGCEHAARRLTKKPLFKSKKDPRVLAVTYMTSQQPLQAVPFVPNETMGEKQEASTLVESDVVAGEVVKE